ELRDSETLQNVIASVFHPSKPPVLPVPAAVWDVASWPAAELHRLATVGSLPPSLRERLGLSWSRERELILRANQEAIPRVWPRMPDRVPQKERLVEAVVLNEAQRFFAAVEAAVAPHEGVEERMVEGFAFTLAAARRHVLLNRLLRTEPEMLLPFVTTQGGPVLAAARGFL